MSYNNFHRSGESFVTERQILEPETSCEDCTAKRRHAKEFHISLRRCRSVDGSVKKLNRNSRKLTANGLKVPDVPEKIVNIVNILQHENFLEVVDRFFKPKVIKHP